jgi:hypothetical protein
VFAVGTRLAPTRANTVPSVAPTEGDQRQQVEAAAQGCVSALVGDQVDGLGAQELPQR